jgi:SAM-dependent methyltransferase
MAILCGPMLSIALLSLSGSAALVISGIEIPHARRSATSRALDNFEWTAEFPYTTSQLTPSMAGSDQLFYIFPKFVHHAGDEARQGLTRFYECVLPPSGTGVVLDLCSSFTSHYPKGWQAQRCVALGLNPLELAANPSKTEWIRRDLNDNPQLPFDDATFDVITNSLSVDYMTRPLELFAECWRVLKPGGLVCMAFTNRCFPTKVVPLWTRPFTDVHHAQVVGSYFHFCDGLFEIEVADVSPDGWTGERDPMIVVVGRKPLGAENSAT